MSMSINKVKVKRIEITTNLNMKSGWESSVEGRKERKRKRNQTKSGGGTRRACQEAAALGCLSYQFAQKCQSAVTFLPTASPAAQPPLTTL